MAREGGRVRGEPEKQKNQRSPLEFTNPYPWMSGIEAMVQLALEEHQVPFSWRWMDAPAPTFIQLLANQGFQPEFTIKEHKLVILVQGAFFGMLPGVLDKVALAKVALEADGFQVVILWDADIREVGAWNLLIKEVPALGSIKGKERPNPYGHPDTSQGRSVKHGSRAMNAKLESIGKRDRSSSGRKRSIRRGGNRRSDSGRTRIGESGAVSGGFKSR